MNSLSRSFAFSNLLATTTGFRGIKANGVAIAGIYSFANAYAISKKTLYIGGGTTRDKVLNANTLIMGGNKALYNINSLKGDSVDLRGNTLLCTKIHRRTSHTRLGFVGGDVSIGGKTAI